MGLSRKDFRKRTLAVVAVLGLAFAVVIFNLLQYTVLEQDEYLSRGQRLAWRKGEYYPIRAGIYDRDGVPLAWSVRMYRVTVPSSISAQDLEILKKIFPERSFFPGAKNVLENIAADKLPLLNEKLNDIGSVEIIATDRRISRSEKEVKQLIGQVSLDKNIVTGTSGLELKYNTELTGKPGSYKVMLDRHGKWINGSWESLELLEAGKGIRLKLSLREITNGGGGS